MSALHRLTATLPRESVVPDYGAGGLFGLIRAIGEFLDGDAWRVPGGEGDSGDQGRAPVLVFILIDGLGDDFLRRVGEGGSLLEHRAGRLTSVFPSTTASAVTSVLTGLAPAAHGLTGWFVNDRRFGGVIAPLPMTRRAGGRVRGLFALPRLFPYRSIFQHRRRPCAFVLPQYLAFSPFSCRHGRGARIVPFRGLGAMMDAVACQANALRAAGGGYVHAYYPVFDALSHSYGCRSPQVTGEFGRIDDAFRSLLARLDGSGVEVVVSADHGFIDAPESRLVRLERHPEAQAMLAGPLFGERRAAFCDLKRGAEADFAAFVREELTGKAVLAPSDELIRGGLFGPGPAHRRLRERVGSHALLMEPGWTIRDRLPGERHHKMVGVHGGLSPLEMWVPLIHARC